MESMDTHYPSWYSSETGIYSSTHPLVQLPDDQFLDVVSFVFSHQHHAISALIDSSSGFSIPYSDLFPLVKSMASGLHHLGISHGDVVLLMLPNSVYFPVVFLGVLYLGAIVTTMSPFSSVREIEKQITDCNAAIAFTIEDNISKLEQLGMEISSVCVPENPSSVFGNSRFSAFHDLIYGDSVLIPRVLIKQEDTAAILYSSGTTGVSKGVVLTHRNLIASIELFVRFEASQYEHKSSDNVYLDVLPMFHIYGMSLFVMGLFSLGTTIVVMRKFDVDEVMIAIDKYRVTHFPTVPPILIALTKRLKSVCGNALKSLKQVSSGAASLSEKVIDGFVQTFPHVDFIQGYGMTESTAVGTRGFNTEKCRKYNSIGLLAPNTQAKVVDYVTGASLPPGVSGELWLRGPGTMKGYLKNAEATMSTLDNDGWLHTGDIVYIDKDGYLYMIDRVKEMIKYRGFQIAPADLEAVLTSHPEILDAAVTAACDKECGEIPVAFIVRNQGSQISDAAVIDYVAKQVAPYKKVRKVIFVESIPRSAAGKILRRVLKNSLISRL